MVRVKFSCSTYYAQPYHIVKPQEMGFQKIVSLFRVTFTSDTLDVLQVTANEMV
jgi:hypothetical protein